MTGRVTDTLFVRRIGNGGPHIILLHGLGASGQDWRLVAERLAPEARVACPDLLGFGRSPWPEFAYSVADHLAALDAALARIAGDQPVHLVGHSTGAVLALEWAASRPARFETLSLFSLPVYCSADEARERIAALSWLAWASVARPEVGALICEVMCRARPLWRALVPFFTPGVPRDISRDYVLHNWASYSGTLTNVLIEHRIEPAARAVAAAGVALQLFHGGCDLVAPVANLQSLARRYGWPLHLLREADHYLPVLHPAACARVLRFPVHGGQVGGLTARY